MNKIKTAAAALVASAGLTLGAFAMASPAMADETANYSCDQGIGTITGAFYAGGASSAFSFTADVSAIVPGDYSGLTGTAYGVTITGDVVSGFVQFDGTVSGTSSPNAPSTVVINNPTGPNITCTKI